MSAEGEYRVEALVNVPTLVMLDGEEYELAEVEEAEEVSACHPHRHQGREKRDRGSACVCVRGGWGGARARECACFYVCVSVCGSQNDV